MEIELHALLAGVVAGLAVAIPLGAIGVLLLQEGLIRGWRSAAAAAAGVALVDLGYATVATVAGTAVTRALSEWTRPIQLVGAAVLVAVAIRGLLSLRATSLITTPSAIRAMPDVGTASRPFSAPRPFAVLRRFVAMTLINPLTAVYFVVLAAGLGSTVAGARAGTAFVGGVFIGSLAWQLVLAAIGSAAGARFPDWARMATGLLGYLTVIGYAARLAMG